MARKRKANLVESTIGVIDNSYAESGMVAAWASGPDDPGLAPSSRTLDPVGNRHLDEDPLAKSQVFNLNLKTWRIG